VVVVDVGVDGVAGDGVVVGVGVGDACVAAFDGVDVVVGVAVSVVGVYGVDDMCWWKWCYCGRWCCFV